MDQGVPGPYPRVLCPLPRLLRPQSGFPESPYLAGGYGEIDNEIDNLDNLGWQGRGCLVLAQV